MKLEPDFTFRPDCPSRAILDQIMDKWSLMTLAVLREPQRFNAIRRRLDGVTQRVLSQTLRKLERNGLVTRTVIATPVLGVEYASTPLGRSLRDPFARLFEWTVENMGEIQDFQRSYDAREDALVRAPAATAPSVR